MIDKNTGEIGVGKNGEGIPIEEVKPHVLEQIYRDDTGVNEYLSKERTLYAKYDFTDIEKVKKNRVIREERFLENMKNQILFDIMNIALYQSYSSVCKSEFYECLYQIYYK